MGVLIHQSVQNPPFSRNRREALTLSYCTLFHVPSVYSFVLNSLSMQNVVNNVSLDIKNSCIISWFIQERPSNYKQILYGTFYLVCGEFS